MRGTFDWCQLPPAKRLFRALLPRRWVAERTFSRFGQSLRLAKDFERLCETSEALFYTTMCCLML
jgi:transposase